MLPSTNQYKNLRAEFGRNGISIAKLAKQLGICTQTLSRKLSRKTAFTLPEAIKIRDTCFPDRTLEYLFEEDFHSD